MARGIRFWRLYGGSALAPLYRRDELLQMLWPLLSLLAIIYRMIFLRRTRRIVIIGSLGKTTTYHAVHHALGIPINMPLNRNSKSYVALRLLQTPLRAPFVIIEVGIDRTGQMARYAAIIKPTLVIVTAIASEHNRSLGSLEKTAAEKSLMVRKLPANGFAILNGDDPLVLQMASATRARVISYGFTPGADIQAREPVLHWPHGMALHLSVGREAFSLQTRLFGRHLMYAVMAGMATAHCLGRDLAESAAHLEKMAPVPGRMQLHKLPSGAFLLRDDFKSTLETINEALDIFAQIPAHRKIVVLGEVSEPPSSQGPIYGAIGERLAGLADQVVFVAGKNSSRYLAGIRRASGKGFYYDAHHDMVAAHRFLDGHQAGDVILVKGRDTERLDRISLHLLGRKVGCVIPHCDLRFVRCEQCPMLDRERGFSVQEGR